MVSGFCKINADSVLALVSGQSPFVKCPENITASHCSPRAHNSLRATKESLWLKLWLIVYHQNFPGQVQAICCYKSFLQLVG